MSDCIISQLSGLIDSKAEIFEVKSVLEMIEIKFEDRDSPSFYNSICLKKTDTKRFSNAGELVTFPAILESLLYKSGTISLTFLVKIGNTTDRRVYFHDMTLDNVDFYYALND